MTTIAPEPALHRPKRALVAAGEVALAVLLGLAAAWCWNRGVLRLSYPVPDHPPLRATRYLGNWIGTSIALGTAAGALLIDAVRQTVLAVRARASAPAGAPAGVPAGAPAGAPGPEEPAETDV
ncbi:hypothetical protein JOF41_005691 [Saccharothrix coeruleofusca]|uniref:hypothetical protein n=1 Tax=Saccharothrix coeruleofusca TaxID=33919 RepID=UPI001AE24E13|nr:hypothetical protein [Saccharothrix coeruleofusca]MBP2339513.1 hypothetical protein [Saccharothrix coeruleofusca]